MTINEQYNFFYKTLNSCKVQLGAIKRRGQQEFKAEIRAEKKQLQKKLKAKVLPDEIPENTRLLIKEKLLKIYKPQVNELEARIKDFEETMYVIAPKVEGIPQDYFILVRKSSQDDFASQGSTALDYARTSLMVDQDKFDSKGLTTHIVARNDSYELWVNCDEVVADAISKSVTINDMFKVADRNGLNRIVLTG